MSRIDEATGYRNVIPVASSQVAYDGHRPVEAKRVPIVASDSGSNLVVDAVAGKRILVLAYNIMSDGSGTVTAKFQSDSDDISGRSFLDSVARGKVVPYNPLGWFVTEVGEALNLALSAAIPVEGELVYTEIR